MNMLNKPIIFFSTGRSGSTVISNIVMQHPDLAFPSQYSNHFPQFVSFNYLRTIFENRRWHLKRFCIGSLLNRLLFKPIEAYRMWQYLTGSGTDFSRDFLIGAAPTDERILSIRKYFNSLVQNQHRKRLAFKITGPSRLDYISKIFPDAIYINITRDPVPVVASFLKIPFWKMRGYNQLWWRGAYSKEEQEWAQQNKNDPLRITCFQLKKVLEVTAREISGNSLCVKEISYENFITNPGREITEILKYSELDYHKSCFSLLGKLEIKNRGKGHNDYFSLSELREIERIMNSSIV